MKIYISSTYRDLREYRAAVDQTLRRMGHDVIGMEQYVAEGTQPLERCLADVKTADAYLLILGWRYGYVITGQTMSVTELEFQAAQQNGTPILAFLMDPDTPWPPSQIDAMSSDQAAASNIARFRNAVGSSYLAGIFRTPEDLASQAAAAVSRQRLGQSIAERLLDQDSVNATDMNHFGAGGAEINPSSMGTITEMVTRSGHVRALVVDLGTGDAWWSTRLYLLASLLRALTQVRQIIFRSRDAFGGMASPSALLDGMAGYFPELAAFRQKLRETPMSPDTQREIERQTSVWNAVFRAPGGAQERDIKVGVRAELLDRWLGERLVDRCIRIDESGPTLVQVQQIVDSLLLDLPVERHIRDTANERKVELRVVCRDTFALALAREWVRASMPRMRIE